MDLPADYDYYNGVPRSPVSGADSIIIFCTSRNFGWAASCTKPRITASLVVSWAPASLIAFNANSLNYMKHV